MTGLIQRHFDISIAYANEFIFSRGDILNIGSDPKAHDREDLLILEIEGSCFTVISLQDLDTEHRHLNFLTRNRL